MRRALALAALLTFTGCTFLTGVDAVPVPCTMARAKADTASGVVVNAAGDTTRVLVSVGRCRP